MKNHSSKDMPNYYHMYSKQQKYFGKSQKAVTMKVFNIDCDYDAIVIVKKETLIYIITQRKHENLNTVSQVLFCQKTSKQYYKQHIPSLGSQV